MIGPRYFDPDGKPMEAMEWAELFEKRDLADTSWWRWQTKVGEATVSTVWIGIDHAFFGGPPLFWETMIFGGEYDEDQRRYSSKEEALAGHERIVAALREGREP